MGDDERKGKGNRNATREYEGLGEEKRKRRQELEVQKVDQYPKLRVEGV